MSALEQVQLLLREVEPWLGLVLGTGAHFRTHEVVRLVNKFFINGCNGVSQELEVVSVGLSTTECIHLLWTGC